MLRQMPGRGLARRAACRVVTSALLLGCAAEEADAPDSAASLPHVLLIVVDTLRADHLSIYGYPRATTPTLERYFADADRYEHAYTAATYTSGSVVSLLSGLHPGAHGIRDFYVHVPEAIPLLPERLSERGYETAAIVSNTVLTDEALGWAERFDYFDDFVDTKESKRPIYERGATATTNAALRWLETVRESDRPHFLLLHYMDPHAPYDPPRGEGAARFEHAGPPRPVPLSPRAYQYLPGVEDVGEYIDRYDEEIAHADRELGRFLDAYARVGFLDRAIVVFTSDHGETLLEDPPYFEHSPKIGPEVLRVPLLVRKPGNPGALRDVPVSLVDLTPSIVEWITGSAPTEVQGIPFARRTKQDVLFQESRQPAAEAAGRSSMRSAIYHGVQWRYTVDTDGRIVGRGRRPLDRSEAKPPENSQAAVSEADQRTVHQGLAAFVRDERERAARLGPEVKGRLIDGPKHAPDLEPHQREALRALGYVE